MKKSLIIIFLVLFIPSFLMAQEEEKKDVPYWYVMSFKVPWDRIDSLKNMVKQYTIPVVAEAKKSGKILDYNLLIHHTGDEYNVVIMTKFPSWSAIGEGAGFGAAMEIVIPDKEDRDKMFEELKDEYTDGNVMFTFSIMGQGLRDFDEYGEEALRVKHTAFKEFFDDNSESYMYVLEYEDCGELGTIMEHRDIFRNLEHVRFSFH